MVFDADGTGLDIGLLCAGWTPDLGGVETHTSGLAAELIARGHRVHVLCMDGSPELEPYSTNDTTVDGVFVRRMAYRYHDHGALIDLVESARAEDVIHAWLAEVPVDLVHVHHATGFGLSALRAIRDVGRPCALTLHDYWPLCPRGQMVRTDGEICREVSPTRCAPCIAKTWPHLMPSGGGAGRGMSEVALSTDEEAAAARTAFALEMLALPERLYSPSARARAVYVNAGLDVDRIRVIENGVDVAGLRDETERLRLAAPRTSGTLRLGVLGTVLPSKGALELARAFQAAELSDCELHVHGSLPSYHGDESYVQELQALAESDQRIHVHGPFEHADLAQILSQLDGVAAPSRWEEVYGLTVREARAAGLPVLVSDAGDLAAVACSGAAGIVVDPEDQAEWVAALQRFAHDMSAREAWVAHSAPPRSTHEMALELEHSYLDLVLAETGRIPDLDVPVAGFEQETPTQKSKAPAPKRSIWRRFFG